MKRSRWLLYGGVLAASLVLAFLGRDVVRDTLITPLAYLLWEVGVVYWAVPQLAKWFTLVLLLCVAVLWQIVPDITRRRHIPPEEPRAIGQVESLARWIARARHSNYFKWQLANRLGRLSRKLEQPYGPRNGSMGPADDVQAYLTAGIDRSFVDFPGPRHPFQRRPPTPLDVAPGTVVDYLESQTEVVGGRRT